MPAGDIMCVLASDHCNPSNSNIDIAKTHELIVITIIDINNSTKHHSQQTLFAHANSTINTDRGRQPRNHQRYTFIALSCHFIAETTLT